MKYILIMCAALLLSSAAPTPARALPEPPAACLSAVVPSTSPPAVVISGTVEGPYRSGVVGPIGAYTAYGDTPAQAALNAACEVGRIRAQATAQAVGP